MWPRSKLEWYGMRDLLFSRSVQARFASGRLEIIFTAYKCEVDGTIKVKFKPELERPQCAPRCTTNSRCLGPFKRSSCFVVHDKTSQPLAYIHFEEKSGRLSPINQLTRDEAQRIAVNIAKLPELLRKT